MIAAVQQALSIDSWGVLQANSIQSSDLVDFESQTLCYHVLVVNVNMRIFYQKYMFHVSITAVAC